MKQYLAMTQKRLEESSHKVLLGAKSVVGPKRSGTDVMVGWLVDTTEALGDFLVALLKRVKVGFLRCGKLVKQAMN